MLLQHPFDCNGQSQFNQSQGPRMPFMSPRQLEGGQIIGPSSFGFPGTLSGHEVASRAARTSGLTCCDMMPVPRNWYLRYFTDVTSKTLI